MNYLIICNTPYQVFNAVNILVNDVEVSHAECDVLIDETFHAFKDSKSLGSKMLKKGLCRNVYYTDKKQLSKKRLKIESFLYLFQKNHLKEFTFSDNKILDIIYDKIWVGDGNILGWSLYEKNKDTEVIWYDDGVSSYAASPRSFGRSRLYGAVMKFFRLGAYRYNLGKLYVNNSAFAMTKDFTVQQLPVMDEKNTARDIIGHIFDYKEDSSFLRDYRFVALIDGQILEGAEGYNGTDMEEVISRTGLAKSEVIIRRHPRDTRQYSDYIIDEGANMWELECIKTLNDSHVLLSCCSTAQLTPKLICQKEPYLVFLYKIFLVEDSLLMKENAAVVNSIKNMYSDSSRVFVPDDLEELSIFISGIQDD